MLAAKFTKFLSFLKQQVSFSSNFASLFIVMRHNSSILFQLKFYILSTKSAYQSTNSVKFHVSSYKSEILHSDELFLSKSYTVLAKRNPEELPLMTLKSDEPFKEEPDWEFQSRHEVFGEFYPTTQNSENFPSMSSFCPKYIRFELKDTEELSFMTLDSDAKFE